MSARACIRWLVFLAFLATWGARADRAGELDAIPDSPGSVAMAVAPIGWGAIERRVRRGVRRGVSSFHFELADREDVTAIAMEHIWRAFNASAEPIRHPEAWASTIAERVGLDELRRQRRDRTRPDGHADAAAPRSIEQHATQLADPLERVVEAERCALVRRRVQAWPPAERRLAELMLDGHADTVTAAAWLYRIEEEAQGKPGTMYPQRARLLLDARRGELEDLV